MSVKFTHMGPEGAALLAELQSRCFVGAVEQVWNEAEFTALLTSFGTAALVILEEGQPVGFLLYRKVSVEVEIQTFCILPEMRRRGMGRRLMDQFYGLMTDAGMEEIILEVRDGNQAAIALYRSQGFEIVGRRRGYYGGIGQQGHDALVMKGHI